MTIFLTTISLSFFFVSHSLYRNLFSNYINNYYINIFVYIILFLLGQSFWLLFSNKLNKIIEYPVYILTFVFSFMFFYYIIIDLVRIFYLKNNIQLLDLKVLIFSILLGIYGFFNRYNIRITNYKIKTDNDLNLKIAFLSDLHIGDTGLNEYILRKTANKINKQNVDILILGGDIIEQDHKAFTKNNFNEYFKKIKTTYGLYAVLGNHEYYGRKSKKIIDTLQNNGNIKVLDDELIEFKNFILIGRSDQTKEYFGEQRSRLEEILKRPQNKNNNKYKIVIDHNPSSFNESINNDISLQLSGHTHNGQFFPFNLIVKLFYKKPYGLLDNGYSKLITSSGLSTWRIPIKLLSKPEIVIININND